MEFWFPFPMEYFLPRMLRTLSLYFLGLIQAQIMGEKIWNISSFLILVKYYAINKFYETIPIITNKKGTKNGHFWDTLIKTLIKRPSSVIITIFIIITIIIIITTIINDEHLTNHFCMTACEGFKTTDISICNNFFNKPNKYCFITAPQRQSMKGNLSNAFASFSVMKKSYEV